MCLLDEESDVLFCVGSEEISCVRCRIASLSDPFNAMLYGGFAESNMGKEKEKEKSFESDVATELDPPFHFYISIEHWQKWKRSR